MKHCNRIPVGVSMKSQPVGLLYFSTREDMRLENFEEGTHREIELEDGSALVLKKIDKDYDLTLDAARLWTC